MLNRPSAEITVRVELQPNYDPNLERRAQEFRLASEFFRNWDDRHFRESVARNHNSKIMEFSSIIESDYLAFLNNKRVSRYLERRHPQLYQRAVGPMRTLRARAARRGSEWMA